MEDNATQCKPFKPFSPSSSVSWSFFPFVVEVLARCISVLGLFVSLWLNDLDSSLEGVEFGAHAAFLSHSGSPTSG